MVTAYKDIYEKQNGYLMTVETALDRIRHGQSKALIQRIRSTTDKVLQGELKKGLPCILFSGEFKARNDKDLLSHSGFICLDFDKLDNLELTRKKIQHDPIIYACWLSPRGNGLKALVKVPPIIANHRSHWFALQSRFAHFAPVDPTCLNESRVCYESYDRDIYINPEAILFKDMADNPKEKSSTVKDVKGGHISPATYVLDVPQFDPGVTTRISRLFDVYAVTEDKRNWLFSCGAWVGGFVAAGRLGTQQGLDICQQFYNLRVHDYEDAYQARVTVMDGFDKGIKSPIYHKQN